MNIKMMSLDDTNYHLWNGKMKDFLLVKKMHLPVFFFKKSDCKSDEEWKFEHQQVYVSLDNVWKIMFIIILLMRQMQKLYWIR